jgi:hypothetical protein
MSEKIKIMLCRMYYLPILAYGAETVTKTKRYPEYYRESW